MSVANGDINLNVNLRGTGDAPAKLEQTRAAIGKVEGAAKSTTSQFVSLRGGISEVASVASSAAGEMTRDFSAVVGLVSDASSRFGALGAVVGGVVAAVGGLVYAFVELDKARFENVTRSLQGTANAAGALAVALATSANKARELQTTMRSAEVRALTAQIASARARGDTTGAASLAGQLTVLQSGDEAGALRAQGVGAFAASAEAVAQRAAATAILAKTDERLAFINGQLGQKAIVLQENGRYVARDELQAEKAGLLALRSTQVGSLALLSQNASAQNVAAASALYKAADAVQTQGLLEASTGALNNAIDVLRAAGVRPEGGGGGGGGARVGGDRRYLDGQFVTKDQRDLYRALLGAGTDTGLMGIVGQGIIDRAFVAQGDKGIRLEDGAGSMADVSVSAADNQAKLITGAIAESGDRAQLGADIRDFTSALSAAVPEMDAFHGALAKIGDIWSEWGKGAMNAKTAVVGSLAAIGLAGAESIKNEQLRAGVRALILGAEGAVHLLTPGYQALGAAEIAAAGVLGAIALGGGGGSSSSSRAPTGGGGARALRPMSDAATNAALVVNINAPWFGPSPQEAAAGLSAFLGRAAGTGFGG